MPDDKLKDFSIDFHNEIEINAQALEDFKGNAFTEKCIEVLTEYGEVEDLHLCHYQKKGIKIDGYYFDELHENLTLVVTKWIDDPKLTNAVVGKNDIEVSFKRVENFLVGALNGSLKNKIEISNEAYDLCEIIHSCKDTLLSVKYILLTDGVSKERAAENKEIEGLDITKIVWDISRIYDFEKTGLREEVSINFDDDFGGPIKSVKEQSQNKYYDTYLAFVSGDVLASVYSKWKIQLLERNVRVFLSQRPKINQGIRDTIINDPEMFCAYNNGITVVAKSAEVIETDLSVLIQKVNDFQIVNGGQTTASLYHTKIKNKEIDLSKIMIQMKLMIINDSIDVPELKHNELLSDVLIPKIGLFSNSQNKISAPDLRSNDPPHPELHAISQGLAAPDPTGGSLTSYWYYEKSRGSYEEKRKLEAKTKAQQKKYDQKFPKNQKFDKIKFSKSWNCYLKLPHIVCLGATKNFNRFNDWLIEQKDEDFEIFFKKTVALIIMWNSAQTIVRRQKFGGYTTEIAVYSLCWLHELTKLKIDLDKIWQEQVLDPSLCDSIELLSIEVNKFIRDTTFDVREYAKKEICWVKLKDKKNISLPNLNHTFISTKRKSQGYDSIIKKEEEDINFCKEKGADAWKGLSKWLKDREFMQGKQRSQCFTMGRILDKKNNPSPILSKPCRIIWEKAETLGWDIEEEI